MKRWTRRRIISGLVAGALAVGMVAAAPLAASAADQTTTRITKAGTNNTTLDFKFQVSTAETQKVYVYVLTKWKKVSSTRATLTEVTYAIHENSKYCFSVDAAYNGSPSGDLGVKTVCAGEPAVFKTNIVTTTSSGNRGQVYARFKGTLKGAPALLTVEYHN